jgi:hypothetical protein
VLIVLLPLKPSEVVNGFLKQPFVEGARSTNLSEIARVTGHLKTSKADEPSRIQNIILKRLLPTVLKLFPKYLKIPRTKLCPHTMESG